jgi:hypothetical protein
MKAKDCSGENRSRENRPDGFRLRLVIAAAALLVICAGCAGCLWIAIPSLAYQGYKYESGDQTGQAKQHQNSQPPANHDVE